MNLSDLRALQASKAWERFYFLSENQTRRRRTDPLRLSIAFDSMDIMTAPPVAVYFKGMWGQLSVNSITAVDCEPHVLGHLIKIACKGKKEYVIVAQ